MTDGILSGTIEVQCGDLIGPSLDWAVAKVEGVFVHIGDPELGDELRIFFVSGKGMPCVVRYLPSADWRFGGPLIASHQIELSWDGVDGKALWWKATHQDIVQFQMGETPLIAACRAIVAAHMGEVVSVPAKLISPDAK
jgi:hypothetical protein